MNPLIVKKKKKIKIKLSRKQLVISDDDIIDYSVKPEFYDPKLDDKDQLWVQKKKKGQYSDAVLSCPACFTTLCLECQRHEKYVTQYRAVFVVNCKVKKGQVSDKGSLKRKRVRKGAGGGGGGSGGGDESFSPVCCSVCETEVGVIDDDEIYHFFNVLPSESSGNGGFRLINSFDMTSEEFREVTLPDSLAYHPWWFPWSMSKLRESLVAVARSVEGNSSFFRRMDDGG
ncbi:putative E2F-associated phosphoprotein [Helianthus annuus]|nr:putative E2F-associated phosphoprotein [Helianthus annuus]